MSPENRVPASALTALTDAEQFLREHGGQDALKHVVGKLQKLVEDNVANGTKGIEPTLWVRLGPRDGMTFASGNWEPGNAVYSIDDIEQRRDCLAAIAVDLYDAGQIPLSVAFASEIWTAPQDVMEGYEQVADCPHREEGVCVQALSFVNESVVTMAPIKREHGTQQIQLGKWSDPKPMESYLLRRFYAGYAKALSRRRSKGGS